MSSNLAMAVFHSGPSHSPSRRGFKCTFKSASPTPEPQCGRVLTAASGSFQSPNWPQTYPINIDCVWTIELPDPSKQVEISFESPFGIAGSLPACNIDHLFIHDDHANIEYGPFCYFTLPDVLKMSSNQARVVFHAGPAHSSSRLGFKANYRSVDPPTTSTCPLLEGNIVSVGCIHCTHFTKFHLYLIQVVSIVVVALSLLGILLALKTFQTHTPALRTVYTRFLGQVIYESTT